MANLSDMDFASNARLEDPLEANNLSVDFNSSSSSMSSSDIAGRIPAAIMIPTGILLYVLSFLTFVGNAMVLHAIRTDKRLQTVRMFGKSPLILLILPSSKKVFP